MLTLKEIGLKWNCHWRTVARRMRRLKVRCDARHGLQPMFAGETVCRAERLWTSYAEKVLARTSLNLPRRGV